MSAHPCASSIITTGPAKASTRCHDGPELPQRDPPHQGLLLHLERGPIHCCYSAVNLEDTVLSEMGPPQKGQRLHF